MGLDKGDTFCEGVLHSLTSSRVTLTNEGSADDDNFLSLSCLGNLIGLAGLTQEEDILQVKPRDGERAGSTRACEEMCMFAHFY